MDMFSLLHVLPAFPGVLFLLVGALLKRFRQRTETSVRSPAYHHLHHEEPDRMDAAQIFGARVPIRLGAIQAVVGLAVGYTVANEVFPVAYIIVSAVACGNCVDSTHGIDVFSEKTYVSALCRTRLCKHTATFIAKRTSKRHLRYTERQCRECRRIAVPSTCRKFASL
jgi:hypothetical protein